MAARLPAANVNYKKQQEIVMRHNYWSIDGATITFKAPSVTSRSNLALMKSTLSFKPKISMWRHLTITPNTLQAHRYLIRSIEGQLSNA